MPRVNIYFTEAILEDLRCYIVAKHGSKRALSITIEEAVKEYLARPWVRTPTKKEANQ